MAFKNSEEESSRKKYLVPLVILLLCGVAMAGAAYAYSSNISDNDDVNVEYYTVDYGTTGLEITGNVVFNTVVGYKDTDDGAGNVTTTKTVTYTLDTATTSNKLSFGVKMSDAQNTAAFTISKITVSCEDLGTLTYTASAGAVTGGYIVTISLTGITTEFSASKLPAESYNFTVALETVNATEYANIPTITQ